MKGHSIPYSADEMAWLEANHKLVIGDYHRAFVERFGRDDVSAMNLHSLRKRNGWKTGRTGQFPKGSEPHNKGRKWPPGKGGNHPNSRKTQFRKGQLPHNTKFLGHERVSKDGYVEISVAETNPHTGYERRYVLKHRWLWEQANGPVPEGHFLKCLDGDKVNCDPSNWDAMPRAAQVYLQSHRGIGYEEAEPEAKPAILTLAKLRHAAKKARAA